jgi:hypothetical protein
MKSLIAALLSVSVTLSAPILTAQTVSSSSPVLPTMADVQPGGGYTKSVPDAQLLEESREAGLLTDWHLQGRFGHGSRGKFEHAFAPEKEAAKAPVKPSERYELVFPEGKFALPPALASQKGVFYANSSAYLSGSGDWNVYIESGAEAAVFVDGRRVVESGAKAPGVLRGTIHAERGYHSVMVKFTAQAAPFRVAILPPNSGSRRKNNTPYLKSAPASEDLMAKIAVLKASRS